MESLIEVVVVFMAAFTVYPLWRSNASLSPALANDFQFHFDDDTNNYQMILSGIHKERPFHSMLMVHDSHRHQDQLEAFYQFPVPKVIITKDHDFSYRQKFNTEMLSVFVTYDNLNSALLATLVQTLNYRRQTRIFAVAVNILDELEFKREFLKSCKNYTMTNVLLSLTNTDNQSVFYMLQPYPDYHWVSAAMNHPPDLYYPQHWLNMQNTTIITYMAQDAPQALVYENPRGKLNINGYVARLVLLFAERFNASLEMYRPLEMGEVMHFTQINRLTEANKLDIPMALEISQGPDAWLYMSVFYELIDILIIVPCAPVMSTRAVFGILLNEYFFGCVIICILLLSIVHSLIDYYFDGLRNPLNFVLNDKIVPGVLGQSFVARGSPWRSLKLVYFLLFFAGLNISTQFSANMNTLFTSPPYHRQIESYADLRQSSVKILFDAAETVHMESVLPPFGNAYTMCNNSTLVLESRDNFNTSHGYMITSTVWKIYSRRQQFYSERVFCVARDIKIVDNLPHSVLMQLHSPYKEPMDQLIMRVHEVGLMEVWLSSTFSDMLKLKQFSLHDPQPAAQARVLLATDFFWAWMIVAMGFLISSLVFLLELEMGHGKCLKELRKCMVLVIKRFIK